MMREDEDPHCSLTEAHFRLELLQELQKRETERLGKGDDTLPPIDLNRYANKYGGSLPEMAERLKQILIQELDELAELSETIAGHDELREIYEQVDLILRDFQNVSRKESVLTIEGQYGRYLIDLFDSRRPGVLAVCRGTNYCFGNVFPCVETLGSLDSSHGIEGLPDETKLSLALAVNFATGGPGSQEDARPSDRQRLTAPALCPLCIAEGLIDTETLESIDEESGIPDTLQRIRLERIAALDGSWREGLRTPRRHRDQVPFLEKQATLKNMRHTGGKEPCL